MSMFKAESYVGHKLCWPGDLVINSLWAWSRGLGVSNHHGIVSTAYGVYRARRQPETSTPYLHALVRSTPFRWELRVRSKGIWISRLQMTDEAFLGAPFPLPPVDEQHTIASFLDDVGRRIRRYIHAKERLIELLGEEKQAIIHRAVTGQIDVRTGQPYPAYKDSKVDWLGEVPEHWEVRRLKTLSDMQSGDSITAMSIEEAGEYPVYGGNGLRGYTSHYTHDGHFALVGRQGALCGNVHLAHGRFWASEHAVVATLRGGHILDWFGALLTAMNLNQYSIAAAQPGLSVDRVLNLQVPIPPLEEQQSVSTHLVRRTSDLRKAVMATERQISLFGEYRTRLTADVVTGKLDVREAAANLSVANPSSAENCDNTIHAESRPSATEHDVAKEAVS